MNVDIKVRWMLLTGLLMLMALPLGFLTDLPTYTVNNADTTALKLVVRHSGLTLGECRVLDQEELNQLAPNMRRPTICPRAKAPLAVSLKVDDALLIHENLTPSGIHDDGVLALFRKLELVAGDREVHLSVTHSLVGKKKTEEFERNISVDSNSIVIVEYSDDGFRFYQPGVETL